MLLRFFGERVFGARVEGRAVRHTKTGVVIAATFNVAKWNERKPYGTEVYDLKGEALVLRPNDSWSVGVS
jgi:hypothetical protein